MPSYLEKRRQTWYAVVEVPPSLRSKLGRKRLRKTLQTRDARIAELRKWPVVADMKRTIQEAQGNAPSLTEALRLREDYARASTTDEREGWEAAIYERAEEIRGYPISERTDYEGQYEYDPQRLAAAERFYRVATAQATPLMSLVDAWLAEANVAVRTADDYRRYLKRLNEWGVEIIEEMDRKRAGAFVSFLLGHKDGKWTGDRVSVTKTVAGLSSYWRWLVRKGHVETNPWREQAPAATKAHRNADQPKERPFKDEEVSKLLQGPADPALSALMKIGALSGMRIAEIVGLTVADCADGMFRITKAKTAAGVRSVPIHSDLKDLVESLCAGKAPDAPILKYRINQRTGQAMKAGDEFSKYARAVGVAVLVEGRRRSLVNFHSFRRWFITKAEQADQPPHIIEAVVGHKRAGMSLGVYSGGPLMEQFRRCVEAVRLPVQA